MKKIILIPENLEFFYGFNFLVEEKKGKFLMGDLKDILR